METWYLGIWSFVWGTGTKNIDMDLVCRFSTEKYFPPYLAKLAVWNQNWPNKAFHKIRSSYGKMDISSIFKSMDWIGFGNNKRFPSNSSKRSIEKTERLGVWSRWYNNTKLGKSKIFNAFIK